MLLEAFGLKWLAGIVSSVVAEGLKERLKPSPSPEKAKRRALALYRSLRDVVAKTETFVVALRRVEAAVREGVPPAMLELSHYVEIPEEGREQVLARLDPTPKDLDVFVGQQELRRATTDLKGALDRLRGAVEDMQIQLEIHEPDVSGEISAFIGSRAIVIAQIEDLAWVAPAESAAAFGVILKEAERNLSVIKNAAEQLRRFVASEFEFKESF